MCVGEGSSLSWGSLEQSCSRYNTCNKNIPSLHPAQVSVASWVLWSSLSIKKYLDWETGALGLAYQLTASHILLYQCVLQVIAFVLKAKVNEIYIICERKSKLSFMKKTWYWKTSIFSVFSSVLNYAPQTWGLVLSLNRGALVGPFPDCLQPCHCHLLKHVCLNQNSKQQTNSCNNLTRPSFLPAG